MSNLPHINAIASEIKVMQNIIKTSPERFIVVFEGNMVRGVRDRTSASHVRFDQVLDPDKAPYTPIQAYALTVTTYSLMDAARLATLIGGDARAAPISGPVFKKYIKKLKAALAEASFDFSE